MRLALFSFSVLLTALFLTPAVQAEEAQQMEGIWGEIGKLYTIDTAYPIAFQLDSAEYTVAPVRVGAGHIECGAAEKILRVNFTVQNPGKATRKFNQTSLKFTAVDAQNVNHHDENFWGVTATNEYLAIDLKPAQKVSGFVCIITDAIGPVPKLIVEPTQGPVLRYDLKGKATPLEAPIADPADPTGATALATVDAKVGEACPLRSMGLVVDGFSYDAASIVNKTPKAGNTFLRVAFTIWNFSGSDMRVNGGRFETSLTTAAGRSYKADSRVFWVDSQDLVSEMIGPGKSAQCWIFFEVPATLAEGTFTIAEKTDGREYRYAVPAP